MALPANDRHRPFLEGIGVLLAPYPGRLEFAVRLALICAIATLIAEIYQTPEPALSAYVAFFVMKPDRAGSVVISIVMLLLISVVIGLVLLLTVQVIEQPVWRVTAMTLMSLILGDGNPRNAWETSAAKPADFSRSRHARSPTRCDQLPRHMPLRDR